MHKLWLTETGKQTTRKGNRLHPIWSKGQIKAEDHLAFRRFNCLKQSVFRDKIIASFGN